ncbi:MAG: RAMP superfamily CRISPR-associated protein [Coriobacteriales bacterium]|jgi:CRISPR-associated protein Csx10|nr:RAMP superfamily CRISPR-associated protein [Coriobacteriales bacterium]
MTDYLINVTLLSETILGAGQSEEGVVNADVVRDTKGFHYIKASTIKGLVREQLEWFDSIIPGGCKSAIKSLLGVPDSNNRGKLKFWDLQTTTGSNEANEVIRYQTKIDLTSGVADAGSLRSTKVIREGAKFQGRLTTNDALSDEEFNLLQDAIRAIRHLGTNRTRGKGLVQCKLEHEPDAKHESKPEFKPVTKLDTLESGLS